VYVATPSETARRTISALSTSDQGQLAEITRYVQEFLPVLAAGGLVRPFRFFGIDGLRYFDNVWPYFILMEIVQEPTDDTPGAIWFHLILPAMADPPTQARI
jgi:hypothetical protein